LWGWQVGGLSLFRGLPGLFDALGWEFMKKTKNKEN